MPKKRTNTADKAGVTTKQKVNTQDFHLATRISSKQRLRIHELCGHELFTIDGLINAAECSKIIASSEQHGFAQQKSRGPKFGEALRDNGRIATSDKAFAQNLWQAGLQEAFKKVTFDGKQAHSLNSQIRVYRYVCGQHFGKHYDECVHLPGGRSTKYTLLVYLNGPEVTEAGNAPLGGGNTVFYDAQGGLVASVSPKAGMALLHLHGDHGLEHEAEEVRQGAKYVLRSDVVFEQS